MTTLSLQRELERRGAGTPVCAMPSPAPLDMPEQDLRTTPRPAVEAGEGPDARCRLARLVAFGGAGALALAAGYEMRALMDTADHWLTIAFLLLFAAAFAWTALAATSALVGLLPLGRAASSPPGRSSIPDPTPTALVMPIYREDPTGVAARLEAMARDLDALGGADGFEIVVLSDTNAPELWDAEEEAIGRLAARLEGAMAVRYRRREDNLGKKAGNVAQFVRSWGGRYGTMIVLDADSLMSGETLIALRRRMEEEPDLGLLQTVPRLIGAGTPFARLQQFAGSLYGPVAAQGVAAWSGSDGNYWGHNAIIRTEAFASACGLPELPGRAPFGGHVLSHDFVEAALLRRAGWRVEMAPELGGSFEAGPPTLTDAAVRDRRWAQGNVQHAAVLRARGLRWPSRAHMVIGIGSYAASPLWMLMVIAGLALALQAGWSTYDYFPEPHQLHPSWPVFDTERMRRLLVATLILVFLPKIVGLVRGLVLEPVRRGHGGGSKLLASAALEAVAAILVAPVVMVLHTRHMIEILAGRSSGWGPQKRRGMSAHWRSTARPYVAPTVIGLLVGGAAAAISPGLLVWLSPFVAGLALAIPMALVCSDESLERAMDRRGLLRTPEDLEPPRVVALADAIEGHVGDVATLSRQGAQPVGAVG